MLPHQKNDSHPILADYGTDHFSKRKSDNSNDVTVQRLDSFSFKSVTSFQSKFKTPIRKPHKSRLQQSLLLNDTDVISDDEDHIYTRIPNHTKPFIPDTTITFKNFSTITNPKSHAHSTKEIETQQLSKHSTKCSQIIPFYDRSFFKYKGCLQCFFLPDDYSLVILTLKNNKHKTQYSKQCTIG